MANSKQEQQASRIRLQRHHNNRNINRGVGSIVTIDTPPLYSVIPDALVTTSKGHSFATFSPFLLVIGSMAFRTYSVDRFPSLVESANPSLVSNRTILYSTENRGTGDSPTCCFWAQLRWVSCISLAVGYYQLLLCIIW